ncbi:MAG: hypothetical protein ABI886_12745 [Betaproteobacteria bacterium]
MSKLMIALFVSAGIGLAGCATQSTAPIAAAKPMYPAAPISKDAYDTAIKNAETQGKFNKDACAPRTANAKDICLAEANGKEMVAKADAEAAYKNTPAARESARDARAQATYNVSKEKCDNLAGNAQDVCVKEADAVLVKAKANAKVDRVTAEAQQDAATKQAEARKDAAADKRNADYKVALEKCDALAGSTKDSCVSNAKLQYGKS